MLVGHKYYRYQLHIPDAPVEEFIADYLGWIEMESTSVRLRVILGHNTSLGYLIRLAAMNCWTITQTGKFRFWTNEKFKLKFRPPQGS